MSGTGPPEPFELSDADKFNPLWTRLKAHMLDRLVAARIRNDRPQPEHETATIRGEIKALKAMIELGEDKPITDGE